MAAPFTVIAILPALFDHVARHNLTRRRGIVVGAKHDDRERALLQNPEIADAAVVDVPDAVLGEAVAAFIEPEQGTAPTPPSVIEHVRNLVARYKKPKYVFIVDALLRNSVGKVLKRELRHQAINLVEINRRSE